MNGPYHLWLIPLLPFAGFLLNGILGRGLPKWLVTTIALLAPLGSLGIVLSTTFGFFGDIPVPAFQSRVEVCPFPWIVAGALHIDFSFVLDQLSLVMLLVVTGVGFLIHIYSVGYMGEEEGYWRFFAYMNLFLFFMTVLVLAGNALLMFVGWEGVGLASYLLIGFYFRRQSAANAGMKAFVVNRIGDFGFLVGMFLLLANFGTLTFSEIAQKLDANPALQGGVLTAIALCLLLGATGKSAQLPLYVWLPDAMEGPTPVSALIHAATMVTAGVYMIVRTHALFDRSPVALMVVAVIGAATALFAATIGMAQTDIKRVLAYSTISQLGYMFLGCGVAAYSAAIFHLVTHAFFKALLFLGAGAVIHALGGEQDMRKMGGLRRQLPLTFWTMTAAVFAIAGIWPLAGFFSKDAILFAAFTQGAFGKALWFVGLFTAVLTAFYMARLWFLTFFGESRNEEHHQHHATPSSMLGVLAILALLTIGGGFLGFRHGIAPLGSFLAPVTGAYAFEPASPNMELKLSVVAVFAALIGGWFAYRMYLPTRARADNLASRLSGPHTLLVHKYYVDEFFNAVIVKPLLVISTYILDWIVDKAVIGGAAWLLAGSAKFSGALLQRWQSGNIRSYAAWLAAAAAAVLLFVLVPWSSVLAQWFGIHPAMGGH